MAEAGGGLAEGSEMSPIAEGFKDESRPPIVGESAEGSEMAPIAEGFKNESRPPIVGDLTRAFCREDGEYHAAVVTDGPSEEGSYKVVFFKFQRTERESREENLSSQEIEPTGSHLPISNYMLGNPSTGVTTFAVITFPFIISLL